MKDHKLPPLLQVVRNTYDDAEKVRSEVLKSEKNRAPFSYQAIHKLVDQIIKFKTPLDEIIYSVERMEKREFVLKQFKQVIPLLHEHFERTNPDNVYDAPDLYYSLSKNARTKLSLQQFYFKDGQLYLPYIIFWKNNPLSNEQKSLFITLLDEILREEPDFESAKLEIIELSAEKGSEVRSLKKLDTSQIPFLEKERQQLLISTYITGFQAAKQELVAQRKPSQRETYKPSFDRKQKNLFD